MKEKNIYLIYNSNYEILVFEFLRGAKKIVIPSVVTEGKEENLNYSTFFKKFIDDYITLEHSIPLRFRITNDVVYDYKKRKLTKVSRKIMKKYYSVYKDFTLDECLRISQEAYRYHLCPHYVKLEELFLLDIVSPNILKVIDELQQKLYYKKY